MSFQSMGQYRTALLQTATVPSPEAGAMRGASKMLTEEPATTMAVKDRHLYVMDKNGLWFHFEPKDSRPGPEQSK